VDLGALLERARSAPPDRRIEWRDRIAVYGVRGIESVRPWLADPELAAFAIRVIERVGVSGEAHLASQVLRSARAIVPPGITGDVDWALKRLRPGTRAPDATCVPDHAVSLAPQSIRRPRANLSSVARRRAR
jgi:hypothetical protein